jgi:hypothetical protein
MPVAAKQSYFYNLSCAEPYILELHAPLVSSYPVCLKHTIRSFSGVEMYLPDNRKGDGKQEGIYR